MASFRDRELHLCGYVGACRSITVSLVDCIRAIIAMPTAITGRYFARGNQFGQRFVGPYLFMIKRNAPERPISAQSNPVRPAAAKFAMC